MKFTHASTVNALPHQRSLRRPERLADTQLADTLLYSRRIHPGKVQRRYQQEKEERHPKHDVGLGAEQSGKEIVGIAQGLLAYHLPFGQPAIIALSVRAGEIVAVVGSSGSGKSLLAHAIMGILPYNSAMDGEIRFLGTPLTAERVKKLRGHEIVFVPQSVSYLDPLMKIGDQIRNGKKDHSVKEKCLAVLKRYGLAPDIREKYPFQLSGGMTRRVLISTAVMETPKLVIADEPTPGLHMEAATRVMGHFREMADDGAGVLLITHDLELALLTADRGVVLYRYRLHL